MSAISLLRNFARDRRAAVAIIYALTLIPVLGFVGGAVDYARAYLVQSRLQSALDAAILAAGSTPAMSNAERIDYARKVFEANYPASELGAIGQPLITIGDDGILTGTVQANLDTTILGVLGIHHFDIGTTAEARIVSKIDGEVVLVLDYSGSMDSKNKYQSMRDAAIKLVNTLSQNGQNDKVKFGLVPFSGEVYATLPKAHVVNETGSGNWTNCTADRKYPYNTQDTTPTSNDATKWGMTCSGKNCNPYSACSNYSSRGLVVRPLTNDFAAVKTQLQNMKPYLYTHIALGLEFGWHLISPNAPWTEGSAYGNDDILKAIVLLTDGEQTSKGWGPGNTSTVSQAENNLTALCTGVKAKGVILITVAFDLTDQPTINRLRNCATTPSHFFDAKTNSDLAQAFQAITGALVKNLHLSK